MIDKKECEIVQDLLISYNDDILNPKSKKLVEEHLAECKVCQARLKQIKEDIEDSEEREKVAVDYLRKIRIKTRIKSVIIAIGILLLLIIGIFVNKFAKVNSIISRAEKSLKSSNIYIERTEITGDDYTVITKEYYKDGKYKRIWEAYTGDGMQSSITEYASVNSDKKIYIYEESKKAIIEQGDTLKIANNADNIIFVPFVRGINNLPAKIGTALVYTVESYGKDCYVLKNKEDKDNSGEIWIDKETGLPVKEIRREAEKSFFPDTSIVKEVNDVVNEYKYEFDKVTDEDVEVPDLYTYTVEYRDVNMKN